MFGNVPHPPASPSYDHLGFLQKNNNLDDKGRIVSSFQDRSSKNQRSCDNSARDGRFRRSETDFSNLFARGRKTREKFIIILRMWLNMYEA